MSHNSANLTSIADSLWRELLRSHLNVAAVGVIMMILSAAATFGLRHYAIELATINTPITIATGHLETGVQKSIANLRGWMSIDNPRFVNDRNKVWADEIYPAIEELKRLKKNDVRSQKSLSTLETELYDLDMWQWLIEDVAQTPGNTPANALVEQLIEPLTSNMFTAITAMVDIAISTKDSTTLRSLLNLRTVLYQVDNHLLRFINQGTQFDKGVHKKLLSRIDRFALRLIFANPGREMDKEEQLIIFKNALVAYHALTEEAILIRESADWNVSHFLLASTVLPLEQKISRQLNAISKNEQMKATHVAAMVNQIGWWIPLVTATLFLLMLYISYRMAKKESQVFIQPVIELETAKEKITQSLAEANALSRTLMQHEERTRTIVDSSPAGIITITQQGSIQSFNAAAERLFGYTSEQVMNKNVSMLMPANQAMQHDGYLRNFLRTRESKIIGMGRELVGLHSDGTEVDIFLSISEIRFGDSKLFLGMVTDISDQVTQRRILVDANEELQASSEELQAQQEELRVANEELVVNAKALEMSQQQTELKANELEETSRYKSEFMANMSHELRTPLNSLLILSNALSENDEGNLSADEVESATVVRDSGKHLLELINEILNLSKVEAGKMVIENTHITLSVLSTALSSRFKHMAIDKEIGFSINISEVTTEFVSDESMLSHILSNLISNAIKFTTQGEVKLDINSVESSTILEGQDKLLAFSVIDTGIGIAKEQQSTVFEAFQQADGSTNRQYGGTGLGLSIVESYTELLGGTIELKSELGQGSTFTLYLPETPAIENKEDRDAPKGHNIVPFELKSSPPPFDDDRDTLNPNSALFLIIEDDVKFARILFETCHQQHAQAIIAPDGETGINLARTNKYTGIILDYMLPGLDGKSVLAVLESDPITRHIPVHVISAVDDLMDLESFGVIGQLTKPISKSDILDVLEKLQSTHYANEVHLLLIEDDEANMLALRKLFEKQHVKLSCVQTGQEAVSALQQQNFSAMIMDLGLPDMSGFELLEILASDDAYHLPPVIVHTGKELTDTEYTQLKEVTESIVIKSVSSPERLQDEVHLFIHSMNKRDNHNTNKLVNINDTKLAGKVVLLVDDDMRNTFALAKVLRKNDLVVHIAPSGNNALKLLDKHIDIEIILMDIMMPEMDGYQTIGHIRDQKRLADLPIIALTAKAMTGDKEKCLEAGASDYLSKPVDVQKLLVMMQMWLQEKVSIEKRPT